MKRALLILILGCWASLSYAQSPWLSDTRLSTISLEWDKPLFDERTFDRDLVSDASSVLFVTGRLRVNDNIRFVAELPISHFGFENNNPLGDKYSTVIGNIYAGGIYDVNTANPNHHLYLELGVRVPTTPEVRMGANRVDRFGGITGLFSQIDRMESFTSDIWAIPLVGNYVTSVRGPFAAKLRLGSIYGLFVDELKNFENELHLLYSLSALYREKTFESYLGISGRNPYIGNNPDFFDDGFMQIRLGIARPFHNFTPGVYVRKPLGENYNQLIDLAYGFSLEIRG